jgi:hypothetical protein
VKLDNDIRAAHRPENAKATAIARNANREDEDEEDYGAFNHNHGDPNDKLNEDGNILDLNAEQTDQHDFREDIFTLHRTKSSGERTLDIAPLTSSDNNAPGVQAQNEIQKPSPNSTSTKIPPALPARRRRPISDSHPQAVPFISSTNPASASSTTADQKPTPTNLGSETDLADLHLGLIPPSSPSPGTASTSAEKSRGGEDASDAALKIPPQAVRDVEREIDGSGGKKGDAEERLIDL